MANNNTSNGGAAAVAAPHKKTYKKNTWTRAWETFCAVFKTPSAKLGGIIFAIVLFCAIFADFIAPYGAYEMDLLNCYSGPTLAHPFGCDSLGRDILSRLMYGARYSLSLGLVTSLIGVVVGIILGCTAGYFGGWVESVIMRFIEIWTALPATLMTIIMSSVLGAGFVPTMIAMSISGFAGPCRMIRGQILGESGKEYIEAAESINCSKPTIMFSHILPNVLSPLLVSITTGIGHNITAASGLAFIGYGVRPPTPEWGAMLSEGTNYFQAYPHLLIYPGVVIGITVLSINLMGDGLRDAMDPKLRN